MTLEGSCEGWIEGDSERSALGFKLGNNVTPIIGDTEGIPVLTDGDKDGMSLKSRVGLSEGIH